MFNMKQQTTEMAVCCFYTKGLFLNSKIGKAGAVV